MKNRSLSSIVVTGSWPGMRQTSHNTRGRLEVRKRLPLAKDRPDSTLQDDLILILKQLISTALYFSSTLHRPLLFKSRTVYAPSESCLSHFDQRQTPGANFERISTQSATPITGHAPPITVPFQASISYSSFYSLPNVYSLFWSGERFAPRRDQLFYKQRHAREVIK